MNFVFFSRVALLAFGALSIGVIFLIWRNPSSQSNATQIATLLGAVALASIAAYPYLQKDTKKQISTIVLFRDIQEGNLVTGNMGGIYADSYQPMFSRITGHGTAEQIRYQISESNDADLIEKGVLQKLLLDYDGIKWFAEVLSPSTTYGSGNRTRISINSDEPDPLTSIISLDELKRIFSANKFVDQNCLFGSGLTVPKRTSIKESRNDGFWTITLQNPDFEITIQLIENNTHSLYGGAWGVFHANNNGAMHYVEKQYMILIKATTLFSKRYVREINSYWRWYENIATSIGTFDWNTIDQKLIDYHTRESLWHSDKPDLHGGTATVF